MGAIGDYIHYTKKNYLNYGINHKGFKARDGRIHTGGDGVNQKVANNGTTLGAISNAFIKQKENMKREVEMSPHSAVNIKFLESSLNSFANTSNSDAMYDKAYKILEDYLQEKHKVAVAQMDRRTRNVLPRDTIPAKDPSILNQYISKIDRKEEEGFNYLRTFVNRSQQMLDKLEAGFSSRMSQKQLNQIYEVITEVQKMESNVIKELQAKNIPTSEYLTALNAVKVEYAKYDKDNKSFVDKFNDAIALFKTNILGAKGDYMELFLDMYQMHANGLGGAAIAQEFGKVLKTGTKLKGEQGTKIKLNKNRFSSNLTKIYDTEGHCLLDTSVYNPDKDHKFYEFTNNLGEIVAIHETQDKIDNILTVDGKTYKISAKNYNLSDTERDISIVSGMSMLNLLASRTSTSFTNHYLNTMSIKHVLPNKNSPNAKMNLKYVTLAKEAMKMTILNFALKGYKTTADQADTFVVNDNTTGKIRVYDMNSLLRNIFAQENLIDVYTNISVNGKSFDSMQPFANKWGTTPWTRIANLLADVHRAKIHAAIKKDYLKNI